MVCSCKTLLRDSDDALVVEPGRAAVNEAYQKQMHTHLSLKMPRLQGFAWHMQEGQAAKLWVQINHTDAHSSTFSLSRKWRWAMVLVSLHKKMGHN